MSMSTRALRLLPLAALVALGAAGTFAVASPKLDGTIEQARELAIGAVHQGAGAIADRTHGGARAAPKRVRGDRPIPRTGPAPRPAEPAPPPPASALPTRELGGQTVPNFRALRGSSERPHSGRRPSG